MGHINGKSKYNLQYTFISLTTAQLGKPSTFTIFNLIGEFILFESQQRYKAGAKAV